MMAMPKGASHVAFYVAWTGGGLEEALQIKGNRAQHNAT